MRIDFTLYDEKSAPPLRMRTSFIPAGLLTGEYQMVSNFRYMDGGLKVRAGTTAQLGLPAVGAVQREIWEFELDGVQYLVGAFDQTISAVLYTTLWYAAAPFTTWVAITEIGGGTPKGYCGANGQTHMSSTSYIDACVIRKNLARYYGSYLSGRDVVLFQNGLDAPRIWDPKFQLANADFFGLVHTPIIYPDLAASGRSVQTFNVFHQVAASGRSYMGASGVVQKATFKFGTSPVGSGTYAYGSGTANECILLTVANTVAVNDIAALDYGSVKTFNSQLILLTEGIYSEEILSQCKVEIAADNTGTYGSVASWKIVFDPSDTTGIYSRIPVAQDLSSAAPRAWHVYNLSNIPVGSRGFRWIRLTWKGSTTVSPTPKTTTIIACVSGGDLPPYGEWTTAYRDSLSRAESPGFVMDGTTIERISNCGGPTTVSGTNANAPLFIVPDPSMLVDYDLFPRNSDAAAAAATISGGLNGEPNVIDLYLRLPGETEATLARTVVIFTAGLSGSTKSWARASYATGAVILVQTNLNDAGATVHFNKEDRDPTWVAPSAFNTSIPPARTCATANGRLFVGAIRDVGAADYSLGDLYISDALIPFRMSSIQTVDPLTKQLSETSATRLVFAGQQIRKIVATAASADGGSFVYVLTNRHLCALGGSSGAGGPAYQTSQLGQIQEIAPFGTNAPQSVAVNGTAFFYLGHESQVVKVIGGQAVILSRLEVDNLLRAIPASRRGQVCGCFREDRYYLGFSETGTTSNGRVLIWNDVRLGGHWEACDTPPKTAERMVRLFDSSVAGSGMRLLMLHSDGLVSAYEEGTTDLGAAIQIVLWFGDVSAAMFRGQDGRSVHHANTIIDATAQANTLTLLSTYSNAGTSSNTIDLTEGYVTDTVNQAVSVVPTHGSEAEGRAVSLKISGPMTAGSRLHSVVGVFTLPTAIESKAG